MHILAAIASNTWSWTCIITSYIHFQHRYSKIHKGVDTCESYWST
jgi:hypothetical protein